MPVGGKIPEGTIFRKIHCLDSLTFLLFHRFHNIGMEFIENYGNEIDDECPWGNESVDLRNLRVTKAEKMWLAKQIVESRSSVQELKKIYKISKTQLYFYAQNYRKSTVCHEKAGRPRALDEESIKIIDEYVAENLPVPDFPLRCLIRAEAIETKRRRMGNEDEETPTKAISKWSVKRYCNFFIIRSIHGEFEEDLGEEMIR